MPGPIRKRIIRKNARKRLRRLNKAAEEARPSNVKRRAESPNTDLHNEVQSAKNQSQRAKSMFGSGKKITAWGAASAASGLEIAAGIALASGVTKMTRAAMMQREAQKKVKSTSRNLIERRLGIKTPRKKIQRRLSGKGKGKR